MVETDVQSFVERKIKMPSFGAESASHLTELHPNLKKVLNEVIKHWDCQIIDGKRTLAEQVKNVAKGVSKTMESKHLPGADGLGHAVDVMPYPYDWKSPRSMLLLALCAALQR